LIYTVYSFISDEPLSTLKYGIREISGCCRTVEVIENTNIKIEDFWNISLYHESFTMLG
jgi:hypothetical protein